MKKNCSFEDCKLVRKFIYFLIKKLIDLKDSARMGGFKEKEEALEEVRIKLLELLDNKIKLKESIEDLPEERRFY